MFKLRKKLRVYGDIGAAPKEKLTALLKPSPTLTFLYTSFLAIFHINGVLLPLSSAYVPSTPIDLAQVAIFVLSQPFYAAAFFNPSSIFSQTRGTPKNHVGCTS